MKKMLWLLLLLIGSCNTKAQDKAAPTPGKIFFNSYIGLANAKGAASTTIGNGFQAMTGVEYRFNRHSSLQGELNFDSYQYQKSSANYKLDGSVNTIPLTLLYKYSIGTGSWLPYARAGAGVARVSVPSIEQSNGFTSVGSIGSFAGLWQAAAGTHVALTSQYFIFGEVNWQATSHITALQDQSLQTLAFRVGLSAAL